MSIKVITFDLDNTLWDVAPALLRAEEAQRQWLLAHRPGAIDKLDQDALWALKKRLWKAHPELGHNVTAMRQLFLREVQLAAGFDKSRTEEGTREAFAAFLLERQKVELYAQAFEVLQTLAGEFRLGALTNGNADVYKTAAGQFFDFAFLAEEVGASKPAPDMFHAAIEATGVRADEVLHVGDNPEHDVLGALRVGMRAAWVNAEQQDWPEDTEGLQPDATIVHIGELPAAIRTLHQD